jgi:hypothetical protein
MASDRYIMTNSHEARSPDAIVDDSQCERNRWRAD